MLAVIHTSTLLFWVVIILGCISRLEIIFILRLLKYWKTDVSSILDVKKINNMKQVTLSIIFLFFSYWGEAQSVLQQIKMLDFTPIVSYSNRLHIPTASDDTLTIHSVGFGLTVIERSDVDDSYFPWYMTWEYVAVPFVKLDFNFAHYKEEFNLFTPRDGASPLVLSAGATAGKGAALLFFPVGLNGTAAVATDFKNAYFQYGVGYDVMGLSIGVSGLLNLFGPNDSFYKKEVALEIRYLINWD